MASFTPQYPPAPRLDLTEDLFGHRVADPYRWLEDAGSAETSQWLAAEEELWAAYRAQLPDRDRFAARVHELLQVGTVGVPAWRGTARFYVRRDPGQEHGVLYVADDAGERALIDPAAIDPSGRTTLDGWQPDKEGRLLAYQLSSGGNEESLLRVMDVASGELVDGPIDRCRYSGVAWLPGGKAFYYVRRLPPGEVPDGESQYHRRLYLHMVGTAPETDVLVFGEGRDKTTYYGVSVSRDGRLAGRPVRVRPRRAGVHAGHRGARRADLAAGRPGRPAVRVHRPGRAARPDLRRGPGRAGAGGVAGPDSRGSFGRAAGVRDP
jgi:prolyl oligopeptidase